MANQKRDEVAERVARQIFNRNLPGLTDHMLSGEGEIAIYAAGISSAYAPLVEQLATVNDLANREAALVAKVVEQRDKLAEALWNCVGMLKAYQQLVPDQQAKKEVSEAESALKLLDGQRRKS